MKKPTWVEIIPEPGRATQMAICHKCGGKSQYRFMAHWFGIGKHFDYWDWYKQFKRDHAHRIWK
jgi:hypothetical protein